jgi:hypothetical protein
MQLEYAHPRSGRSSSLDCSASTGRLVRFQRPFKPPNHPVSGRRNILVDGGSLPVARRASFGPYLYIRNPSPTARKVDTTEIMHVKNVIVLTWQPSGRERSSHRSCQLSGQIDSLTSGARMGMGAVLGTQVPDWKWHFPLVLCS